MHDDSRHHSITRPGSAIGNLIAFALLASATGFLLLVFAAAVKAAWRYLTLGVL